MRASLSLPEDPIKPGRSVIVTRHLAHEIESIRHKAPRPFAETAKANGLPGNFVDRLQKMLACLIEIDAEDELKVPPNYGDHQLTGDRVRVRSLIVTGTGGCPFA
jgi:proteic killer suppression protein